MQARVPFLIATLATALVVSVGAVQSPQNRQTVPAVRVPPTVERSILDVLEAYSSGDDLAVEQWLATPAGRSQARYVEPVLAKTAPWSRARAAFILEVTIKQSTRGATILTAGRTMVIGRPSALGTNAAEDRFEVLWHQAALGLLSSLPQVSSLVEYINIWSARLEDARTRGATLGSRVALSRAFATAILCCWTRTRGEVVRMFEGPDREGMTIESALVQFERAAEAPALAAEARIRGGKLLFDAGRKNDALAWLERVPAHTDPALGYVQHLTHARLLDPDRPGDAATSYRTALTFSPRAQLAGIGLAAALLRSGQPEEAARAAEDARRMTDDVAAALPTFNKGDARLVPEWLAEIRRLRR